MLNTNKNNLHRDNKCWINKGLKRPWIESIWIFVVDTIIYTCCNHNCNRAIRDFQSWNVDICPVIRNPHAQSVCRHCSKSMNKVKNCKNFIIVSEERLCRSNLGRPILRNSNNGIECCRYWIAIKMRIITESITPADLLSCTL